ncbi:hypothetical protein QQS21_010848 [Conoideocrella luteorostrata]|uniref:Uncharacterized protein n=1 Tax=Conoideocrella luteorostrata TaxID=1105319 RepID=A0AAJ0CGZ1_9HYPO|nr:hypothetical protein QQS21_010848 [Conoideocrella luteorostrata]
MASFARSFKSPTVLLSPRCRPGMPGRTLSNSSELSLTPTTVAAHQQTDYFVDKPVTSAPHTPSLSPAIGSFANEESQSARGSPESTVNSPAFNNSNPISIELPNFRKLSSGPTCTPPEPLSARGDLPGGYFPLHEDPKGRVHRPHPFFHDSAYSRHNRASDSITMQAERARTSHAAFSASMTHSSTPVSSYIAPGFHDAPLPVGKYYPSNYEQQHPPPRSDHLLPANFTDRTSSSIRSDSQVPQLRPGTSNSDNNQMEMRRKMQQYQRDMIAQAAMVLDSSSKTATPGMSLNGLPIKDIWHSGSSSQKPLSPRLHPLGSPGPVTPMELESSGCNYLDMGIKSSSLSEHGLAPSGAGLTANSL